jgi:hypothetical protein
MTQRHRTSEMQSSYQQHQQHHGGSIIEAPVDTLPSWMFDIDEVDDLPTDTSILHELEIDANVIVSILLFMLLNPW